MDQNIKINTPVLLLLYNRADLTKQLLSLLSSYGKFSKIYVSIDGAKNSQTDQEKVLSVLELVKTIEFSDEVHLRALDSNHGCRKAVSSAIDWFFEHEEEGIILEDDCHPSIEFFPFMESMLETYRNDARVAQICGSNTLGSYDTPHDYLFSNFGSIWGWGSWRRAWNLYDESMKNFDNSPELKKNLRRKMYFTFDALFRIRNFQGVKSGQIDTWDYQWMFTRLTQNMLCVIPSITLVNNVGIGLSSTHTKSDFRSDQNSPDKEVRMHYASPDKLREPKNMLPDYEFELKVAELKRGIRGFGPIWALKKSVALLMRRLF